MTGQIETNPGAAPVAGFAAASLGPARERTTGSAALDDCQTCTLGYEERHCVVAEQQDLSAGASLQRLDISGQLAVHVQRENLRKPL